MSHPCLLLKDVPKALRAAMNRTYGKATVKKAGSYELIGMIDELKDVAARDKTNALKMAEVQMNYYGPGGELEQLKKKFDATPEGQRLVEKIKSTTGGEKELAQRAYDKKWGRYHKQHEMDLLSGSGARLTAGTTSLDVLQDGYFSTWINAINKAMDPYMASMPSRAKRFFRKIDPRDIYHAMISPEKLDELAANAKSAKYARQFAEAVKPVLDKVFKELVEAGYNAKYLQNWFMPQKYNSANVADALTSKWISDMNRMLDREKVITAVTAGHRTSLPDKEYHKILKALKDSIGSEGTSKIDLSQVSPYARITLADQGELHRYMHFSDSSARLEFEELYGYMEPFQGIINYIEQSSKNLALLKRLGPDPDAAMRMRRNAIIQNTGDKAAGKWMMDTYRHITGQNIGQGSNQVAGLMKNLTVLQVGAKLTSAAITALTDVAPTTLTALMNNMSVSRAIMGYFTSVANIPMAGRKLEFAREMMITSRHAVDHASVLNRYADVSGVNRATRLSDTALRLTGLNYVTEMGRANFGIEYLRNMHKMLADPAKAQKLYRRMDEMYGFTRAEMDEIAGSQRFVKKAFGGSVEYIDPRQIKNSDLQAKFVAAMREETNHAIPEAGAKTRALISLGTKSNTVHGEMIRGIGQFMSFPTSMVLTHMSRARNLGGWKYPAYIGTLAVTGYGMGLAITQAKALLRGEDTRKLDRPETHRDALIQGGTLGIIGDILLRDLSRQGLTLEAFAGPGATSLFTAAENLVGRGQSVATMVGALLMLSDKSVVEAFDEFLETNRKLTMEAAREFTPSLWQTRALYEYFISDAVKAEMDPDYYEKKRRMATRRYNLYGQEH